MWQRLIIFGALALPILLAGCASLAPERVPRVQLVDVAARPAAPDERTIKMLARAQTSVYEAQALRPWWLAGPALLSAAEGAMARGDGPLAAELAQRAEAAARATATAHYASFAEDFLRRAALFARLRDSEYASFRAAEVAYARGDMKSVYLRLRPLVRHLYLASEHVVVRAGQTLANIAADQQNYDNPHLWPLLFRDNKGLIRDPMRLKPGWTLRLRTHPPLAEIFAAVEYADRRQDLSDPRALDAQWLSWP